MAACGARRPPRRPGAVGEVAHLVEPGLGLAHLLRELVLGRAAPTGQRGLEVRRRLRRPRTLLLVDRLGLLQPDRGVALGAVAVLVGGLARVLDDAGGLRVGLAVHAGGVAIGLVADPGGVLVRVRAQRVDLFLGLGPQLERLGLGQAEDLADPDTEVLVARRLGGALVAWCSSSTRAARPSRWWVSSVTAALSSSSRRSTSAGS